MIRREDALRYHENERPGKIALRAMKPCASPRDLRLAYLPGAAYPAEAIASDPEAVFRYTARGNLVGVITNGSAVPGLGAVGPAAAKPMQEGMAVLFKRLADIDVFDLELDTTDPDRFVETVRILAPTFGGINLKDIAAPTGLYIHDQLERSLGIPVFHENLYSTAVVAAAALLNGLDLVEKRIEAIRAVICGAGTVGLGCARLLRALGVRPENLLVYDVQGLLHTARTELNEYQRAFACGDERRTLAAGLEGADVFLGASAGGVLDARMIRSMGKFPMVFALASPAPEITYAEARAARRDCLVATSDAQDPNAIVDLLSFPYIFRGALDSRATRITEGMLVAAAKALAELAREDVVEEVVRAYGDERLTFGPEYLLPKPIDPRVFIRESAAVARQAATEGVARAALDEERHVESLSVRMGAGQEMLRQLLLKARRTPRRVVFAEGAHETVLRACAILLDEGIAQPILLGAEAEVRAAVDRLGLDLGGITVVDPARSPRAGYYAEEYLRLRRRRGAIAATATKRLRQLDVFAALMLHSGDADLMITGLETHYAESVRTILEVLGPAPHVRRISGHYLVLLPKAAYVLADCAVNIDPDAETLAEIAMQAARLVRSLGLEPRVAMLSFSNFGGVDHPLPRKVRRATELVKQQAPDLLIDGEMQLGAAINGGLRRRYFPFCELRDDANVLIFPDLQAGNLAFDLLHALGEALVVGPVLMGTRCPAHVLQYGSTVEQVVNLTALGIVQAQEPKPGV